MGMLLFHETPKAILPAQTPTGGRTGTLGQGDIHGALGMAELISVPTAPIRWVSTEDCASHKDENTNTT